MANMEDILCFLEKDFPELKVAEMLDEEILEWVDSDWRQDLVRDGYSGEDINEFNWYQDYGRGEAEDNVIGRMIASLRVKYNSGKEFNENLKERLYDRIREEYCL